MSNRGTPKDLKQAIEFGLKDGNVLDRIRERIRHDVGVALLQSHGNPEVEKAIWDLYERLIPKEEDVVIIRKKAA
jgi:hypothetical protein